jgi:glycosyltransferase involved in cell wall biosynthesis
VDDARQPLVSIVTPVLNGARFLPDLLRSIRAQDHPRIEHVVVDGGSTDGTLELLRASGVRWVSGRDHGMYDAINRGFALTTGEVLAYQNADDRYVAPGAVSAAARALAAAPEVDVVYGRFRYVEEDGRPSRRRPRPQPPFSVQALCRYNFIPPHAAFVRRRAVFERDHWLDPTLRFAGDWDWFLRMALAGCRFAFLDEVLAEFRLHPASQTSTTALRAKLGEWRRICRRSRTSFARLVLHELLLVPLRRRLGGGARAAAAAS